MNQPIFLEALSQEAQVPGIWPRLLRRLKRLGALRHRNGPPWRSAVASQASAARRSRQRTNRGVLDTTRQRLKTWGWLGKHGDFIIYPQYNILTMITGDFIRTLSPMTDPWCCYIWCSMDPIKISPFMLAYIPAPWIRHGSWNPGRALNKNEEDMKTI